jgi:hypothetical protein
VKVGAHLYTRVQGVADVLQHCWAEGGNVLLQFVALNIPSVSPLFSDILCINSLSMIIHHNKETYIKHKLLNLVQRTTEAARSQTLGSCVRIPLKAWMSGFIPRFC